MQMTEPATIYFELKGSGDFIRIYLCGLSHPDTELDWDKNWISAKVILKAGGFSGEFCCDLMTTDFIRFRQELSALYNKLDGTAIFNTLEGQLTINIQGDGVGHFDASCAAMDFVGTGNSLDFELKFDQTLIPELVRQLDDIIKTYPASNNLN